MFQSFEVATRPEDGPPRVALLREAITEAGVDAFLIPRDDAHRGENVAACDERLAWLTGFTGSAGIAVVTAKSAVILTDGRYTLQVRDQSDGATFDYRDIQKTHPADWIGETLGEGAKIAYDPWLHTRGQIERYEKKLGPREIELVPLPNLVDQVWEDRPPPPAAPILPYPAELAGRKHVEKRSDIAIAIAKVDADGALLTLPDSIAWLLNIRGGDLARLPVARAFAHLSREGNVTLFVTDPAQVGPETAAHLGEAVTVRPVRELEGFIAECTGRLALDRDTAPIAAMKLAKRAQIVWLRDPCILPKAQKTAAELAGHRAAQRRDGAAMVEFLAWLDGQDPSALTEIDVAKRLEAFRRETGVLKDISFETISGAGPNGAIVHYRVNTTTNRTIGPDTLLLVDSGGQYLDGTTDITRTIAIGTPPRPQRRRSRLSSRA